MRQKIAAQGLVRTWFFEKRRASFKWKDRGALLHLDEIPEFGWFLEIEGTVDEIRRVAHFLRGALGEQEERNYKDVFLSLKGDAALDQIQGAEFASSRSRTPSAP